MIIAIFINVEKRETFFLAREIKEFLVERNIDVIAEDSISKELEVPPISKRDKKKIDFFLSIGGDGTILRLFHEYGEFSTPIIGINMGEVGFMADIPTSDLYLSLQDIIDKKFSVENRLMLEASFGDQKIFAVNEVAIHRGCNNKLIKTAVYVDSKCLSTFSSDGIIVATPNGSTAYSLSAGGPILTPKLEAFVLTAVCPHTISVRPIVFGAEHVVELKYLEGTENEVDMRADSVIARKIKKNEIVRIKKSEKRFNLVKLKRHSYFSTLNSKLGWSGTMIV